MQIMWNQYGYEIILVKDEKTSSSLNDNIKVYLEKEKRGTYSKVVEPTIFKSNITDRELGNDLMSVYKQKKTTSAVLVAILLLFRCFLLYKYSFR